jgi:hypothetical protein
MEMKSSIYNLFICLVQVENKKGVSREAGRLSVVKPPPKIRRRQFSISLQENQILTSIPLGGFSLD